MKLSRLHSCQRYTCLYKSPGRCANMATNAQILANQTNSKRSTGPKTPEGKAVVSRNAVKHGIFYYALDDETPQYQELLVGLFEALKPQDELQRMLVEQIAVTIVRLKRLVRH